MAIVVEGLVFLRSDLPFHWWYTMRLGPRDTLELVAFLWAGEEPGHDRVVSVDGNLLLFFGRYSNCMIPCKYALLLVLDPRVPW
jgi:hypothetical protein